MIDLEKISGLPIELTDDYHLKFNAPLAEVKPVVRKFSEVVPVLMDHSAQPSPSRTEMYYMYRNIYLPHHQEKIAKLDLRYDITVLPPGMIGQEFNKSVGHYHPVVPGQVIAYPELYEVLHGKALFLLQKMDADFKNIITVLAIEATAGQKIVYPPNYGHIIVNIGTEALVTANWVVSSFESLYKPVEEKHGMAYYVVKDVKNGYAFVKNPAYDNIPDPRLINGKFMTNFPITAERPMYESGMLYPHNLEFLKNPQKYAVELSSITS